MEVNRLHLLHHHVAGHSLLLRDRHMKGEVALGICDGTGDAHAHVLVEEIVADHQRRAATSLLVTGLRIEGENDEIPLAGDVPRHLPDLAAHGISWTSSIRLCRPRTRCTGEMTMLSSCTITSTASPTCMSTPESNSLLKRSPWLLPHFWTLVIIVSPPPDSRSIAACRLPVKNEWYHSC